MNAPFALGIHFLHWKVFSIRHYRFHPFRAWMAAPEIYTSYSKVKATLTVSKNYSWCPKMSGENLIQQGKKYSKGALPPRLPLTWGVWMDPVRLSSQINPRESTKKKSLHATCTWAEQLSMKSETSPPEYTFLSVLTAQMLFILAELCTFSGCFLKCLMIVIELYQWAVSYDKYIVFFKLHIELQMEKKNIFFSMLEIIRSCFPGQEWMPTVCPFLKWLQNILKVSLKVV